MANSPMILGVFKYAPIAAQRLCEQSIALYQSPEDRWGMANVLDALGTIVWDRAANDQAGRSDVADVLRSGIKMHLGQHREGRAQAEDGLSASRSPAAKVLHS